MNTLIQELDKKDINIVRNAIRYVLIHELGMDITSMKSITSVIVEERLNKKIDAILNTALDKINKKIEASIEKRLRQSALSSLMYSFEKDVLKPAINDFVENVDVSFDYKKRSDSETDNDDSRATQKLYPVKITHCGNIIHGENPMYAFEIIDFDHVIKSSFDVGIYRIREFLALQQLKESKQPLPEPTIPDSSELHNIIFIGV